MAEWIVHPEIYCIYIFCLRYIFPRMVLSIFPCQPHAIGHKGGEYSVATVATTTGTRNILDITLLFQETKK